MTARKKNLHFFLVLKTHFGFFYISIIICAEKKKKKIIIIIIFINNSKNNGLLFIYFRSVFVVLPSAKNRPFRPFLPAYPPRSETDVVTATRKKIINIDSCDKVAA